MLRKSLIPVFVALMIAVGTMGLAYARTESPIDAPITVKELTDSPKSWPPAMRWSWPPARIMRPGCWSQPKSL